MGVLPAQVFEGIQVPGGRKTASAPAMSKPATSRSRYSTASSAISRDRAAWRMAVSRARTRIWWPATAAAADPAANPSRTASITSRNDSPRSVCCSGAKRTSAYTTPSAARSWAHSDPTRTSDFAGLHDADGVREGLEISDERAGIGGGDEPAAQLFRVAGGQLRIPGRLGELDDRRRAQSTVQVVVQQHLRGGSDGVDGHRARHDPTVSAAPARAPPPAARSPDHRQTAWLSNDDGPGPPKRSGPVLTTRS